MIKNKIVIKRIQREIDELNQSLDKTEQIKKFVLLNDDWSVDNNLLSPTLKLRRKELINKYSELIDSIFEN